jgi:RND family efflux transporter MFP subunit
MENQKADLSGLRIRRSPEQEPPAEGGKSRRGLWFFLGILVVLAPLAYLIFSSALFSRAPTVQLATATLSSPSQADAVLTASGYVVAQRKAAVASKATGRLERLNVVEGDRVKKGEILAQLEDSDIRASLDQARANLKLNEADLKDAIQWMGRAKTLLEKGVSSQADYDGAEARYNRVLAAIEVAKAAVGGAEVALENTLIRAPFDGTVLTKNADVGEMVAPMAASVSSRSAVVTMADMTSLQVEADVSESNIERIIANQPCEITLDAYPEARYQGYVAKIVPTADRAKATVMVKVGFRSYDSRVLPEMSAKVLFLTKTSDTPKEPVRSILTIPLNAVATRAGKRVVYVVRDNRAVEIPVTIGKEFGSQTEITQGLSAGDRVIAAVTEQITNGTSVKIQ